MTLSKKQKEAIKQIQEMEKDFGVRWFTQYELPGITLHTMNALVEKRCIEEKLFNTRLYYRWKGTELCAADIAREARDKK